MTDLNNRLRCKVILATALDGALIPSDIDPGHMSDLVILREQLGPNQIGLLLLSKRSLESTLAAIDEIQLPTPEVIVAEDGRRIYTLAPGIENRGNASFVADELYQQQLASQPNDVNATTQRALAIDWILSNRSAEKANFVFAGHSNDDLATLPLGIQTIVLANADRKLARTVYDSHQNAGTLELLYLSKAEGATGLIEGLRWFEFIEPDIEPPDDSASPTLGAVSISQNRARFTLAAPKCKTVSIRTVRRGWQRTVEMNRIKKGLFSIELDQISPGDRYGYILDGRSDEVRPDPLSRSQPEGVHQLSQLTRADAFPWQDGGWAGVDRDDLIIYELHIGTFTDAGTYLSAIEKLDELVELGVTAIELLPVAQSAGRWNWGYDGVNLFAPFEPYGTPDDLKMLVDAAHRVGLAAILDVVYNHPGPEGNYLAEFGPYFSKKHRTPWGPGYNFDGPRKKLARQYIVTNALYWLEEFHFDGLRLDAIHFMYDDSELPIVAELTDAVRDLELHKNRRLILIGETNIFDGTMIRDRESGGMGFDAIWCDDKMHALYSIGSPETHLTDRKYRRHEDVAEALEHGYLYEGPPNRRVTRSEASVEPSTSIESLVMAAQTHDSVGNQPLGKRIHHLAGAKFQQAAAAINILYPAIPMLFMGDETQEPNPFRFFVDFKDPWLVDAIENARRNEHPQQDWTETVSPFDHQAFVGSKLTPIASAAVDRLAMRNWYRSLIEIRKAWKHSGLLKSDNMTVSCDKDTSVFRLSYTNRDQQANVLVRLLNPDTPVTTPVTFLRTEQVQLCSGQRSQDSIDLFANEVLVANGPIERLT